jgi:Nickel responsive protein SCO4226-like
MPKYIIERDIPNAAAISAAELKEISRRSCAALQQLGPTIQWVQSYVTEDKITCVYIAPNPDIIREHARLGGFPADRILEIARIIDPTTAELNELAAAADSNELAGTSAGRGC